MSDENSKALLDIASGEPAPLIREFRPVVISENPADDYEVARRNIHEVLIRNADSLQELMNVAAQAPHPRVFEVIGQLVGHGLDASQALMDINKKQQDLTKSDAPQVVNNTLVLTSAELLSKLKDSDGPL